KYTMIHALAVAARSLRNAAPACRSNPSSRTKTLTMLHHTFIHLPGVGPHRERVLWQQGILDWDLFLEAAESRLLRQRIYESAAPLVRQSLAAVAAGDLSFFRDHLPS